MTKSQIKRTSKSQPFDGRTGAKNTIKDLSMILPKKQGIEISWDTLVASDWTDKKSVLIASGDLPDAFLGSNAFNDAEIAQTNLYLFL